MRRPERLDGQRCGRRVSATMPVADSQACRPDPDRGGGLRAAAAGRARCVDQRADRPELLRWNRSCRFALTGGSGHHPGELPADLRAGRARTSIPWEVLAGIGQEECDQGRIPDPSCTPQPGAIGPGVANFAGASGPMQIGVGAVRAAAPAMSTNAAPATCPTRRWAARPDDGGRAGGARADQGQGRPDRSADRRVRRLRPRVQRLRAGRRRVRRAGARRRARLPGRRDRGVRPGASRRRPV